MVQTAVLQIGKIQYLAHLSRYVSNRIKLLPGVRIRREEEYFLLTNTEESYRLDPEDPGAFGDLVHQLRRGVTRSELDQAFETDVSDVLDWLRARSFLDTAGTCETRAERIVAAEAGYSNMEKAMEAITSATVGVRNFTFEEAAFETCSVASSPDTIADVDFLVACARSDSELRRLNERIFETDTPCLFVSQSNDGFSIGPLTVPEVTPCFTCTRHQWNFTDDDVITTKYDLFGPAAIRPLVRRDTYRYLGGFHTPDTIDSVLTTSPTSLDIEQHHVFKIPHCDTCGTEALVDE